MVLLYHLWHAVDKWLHEEQAGFWASRSCTVQIFTVQMIIEQTLEYQQHNLVDLIKAFDSMHQPTFWKILCHYGIPALFVVIFQAL